MSGAITMPRLGETMEEGTLRSWLVKPGVPFKRGDVIAEVETDKTLVDMPALADGTIAAYIAHEGDVVPVGTPMATLEGADTEPAPALAADLAAPVTAEAVAGLAPDPAPDTAPRPLVRTKRVPASPAARRLAQSLGVDLSTMRGTGRRGRLQADDIRRAHKGHARTGDAHPDVFAKAAGKHSGVPFVFLHGFGGDHLAWDGLTIALENKAPTLAYDLPGHGRSAHHPCQSPREMATVIAQDLRRRGQKGVNLVGHSMGGAIAALIALEEPDLVRSLTLLAPGGFGPEINLKLLRRFARADTEALAEQALEQMVGWSFALPRMMPALVAANHRDPAYRDRLSCILETLIDGDEQVQLPTGRLADLPFSVRVVWGTQDRVLPTRQSHRLPGLVATHVFERVGHLPHLEIPGEILKILLFEVKDT